MIEVIIFILLGSDILALTIFTVMWIYEIIFPKEEQNFDHFRE